jgi:pyruvate dehydrogenase E2 component (dihydrolipoamide acetyltransferase)
MATEVILPALGMAQETGKIVQWLKSEGDEVAKGDPIAEIETDKATVELEAPASGFLTNITSKTGEDIPVGQVIASILAAGEQAQEERVQMHEGNLPLPASPLAARIANVHQLDLRLIKPAGKRIQKADVLTYLHEQDAAPSLNDQHDQPRLFPASPKARRLASEQGKNLTDIQGSGPQGAVLASDVLNASVLQANVQEQFATVTSSAGSAVNGQGGQDESAMSTTWRIMAERTTQSWTSVPHFYLTREVNASRLIAWRTHILKQGAVKVTYTDLLVKTVATALRLHPRLNASWSEGKITIKPEVHVGLAVAVEEGLVVPVIHHADMLGLGEIARRRVDLVAKAQAGKLRPQDISDGTFTISNLGMYNVDAFNAIINQPQAAILAVGRIADRVVPLAGLPAVQPMMVLTLSCDHRVVDGARGAQFLDSLATLIEEPLGLLG